MNAHLHFHVCVVDGVFEAVVGVGDADTDAQSSSSGIVCRPASANDEAAVAQVQADLRRRILRAFVGRGLLETCDAKEMLRYCAHPPFAMDRLRKEGAARARATQALTGALPVGGANRPHL